jgi:hypothetical protein
MRAKYRIYILLEIPKDLRERISELHAMAIIQAKEPDRTVGRTGENKGKDTFKGPG